MAAELPLTTQSVSVLVPNGLSKTRRRSEAELPLTVQSVSVLLPKSLLKSRRHLPRSCR